MAIIPTILARGPALCGVLGKAEAVQECEQYTMGGRRHHLQDHEAEGDVGVEGARVHGAGRLVPRTSYESAKPGRYHPRKMERCALWGRSHDEGTMNRLWSNGRRSGCGSSRRSDRNTGPGGAEPPSWVSVGGGLGRRVAGTRHGHESRAPQVALPSHMWSNTALGVWCTEPDHHACTLREQPVTSRLNECVNLTSFFGVLLTTWCHCARLPSRFSQGCRDYPCLEVWPITFGALEKNKHVTGP